MNDIQIFVEHSLPFCLIAAFGGLISFISKKEERSVWMFIVDILSAMFVGGIVIHALICETNLLLGYKVAITAISGMAAHSIIPVLQEKIIKIIERRLK